MLPRYDAAQVKSIGDAVMLRVPSPAAAIELGLQLAHDMLGDHGTPAVRVGMHHGAARCRDGDYFGSAVNLAARVSGLAAGAEVLVTASTGSAAGPTTGVLYESRGRHTLKGIPEPVEVVAAVRAGSRGSAGLTIDPVCHMAVDPDRSAGRLMHDDVAYYFCALECAAVPRRGGGLPRGMRAADRSGRSAGDDLSELSEHRGWAAPYEGRPAAQAEPRDAGGGIARRAVGRPAGGLAHGRGCQRLPAAAGRARSLRLGLNQYRAVVRGVFAIAAEKFGLETNPGLAFAWARSRRHESDAISFYRPSEVPALARAASSEQDAAIFIVAAFTGLRMSELRALRWRALDFEDDLVHVERGYTDDGGEDLPKSYRVRSVPMIPQVAAVLGKLRNPGALRQ